MTIAVAVYVSGLVTERPVRHRSAPGAPAGQPGADGHGTHLDHKHALVDAMNSVDRVQRGLTVKIVRTLGVERAG
jgi:hypothetical protein